MGIAQGRSSQRLRHYINFLVAWKDAVPADAGVTLNLDRSDADLKEYIKKDKFTLRVNAVTDEFLASDYHIK